MAKEIISVHLGQAGLQIGSAVWELMCLEHGVLADGFVDVKQGVEGTINNFFLELPSRRYVPRALLFDLEATVIDEIRTGCYRDLWNPGYLLNGIEDASSLYPRGYLTQGNRYINMLLNNIRKQLQECDNFSAFQLIHSFSGGTGSGLGSLLLEKLSDLYGKKYRFCFSIVPSKTFSQSMVDPYNAILHLNQCIDLSDCNIIGDNESLYTKCLKCLRLKSPTITLINRLFSQQISAVFLSHRYISYGSQQADVCRLLINIIPYPRIHFPIISMSSICTSEDVNHDTCSVTDITNSAFHIDNIGGVGGSYQANKYISCCLLYRGNVTHYGVCEAIASTKANRNVDFVDWCPTGFKVSINRQPPLNVTNCGFEMPQRSLVMIAGNVAIKDFWCRLNRQFDILLSKRAFVHHYVGEGMEENEFYCGKNEIISLIDDYTAIAADFDGVEEENYQAKLQERQQLRQQQQQQQQPEQQQQQKKSIKKAKFKVSEDESSTQKQEQQQKKRSKKSDFNKIEEEKDDEQLQEQEPEYYQQQQQQSSAHYQQQQQQQSAHYQQQQNQQQYQDELLLSGTTMETTPTQLNPLKGNKMIKDEDDTIVYLQNNKAENSPTCSLNYPGKNSKIRESLSTNPLQLTMSSTEIVDSNPLSKSSTESKYTYSDQSHRSSIRSAGSKRNSLNKKINHVVVPFNSIDIDSSSMNDIEHVVDFSQSNAAERMSFLTSKPIKRSRVIMM